MGTTSQSETIDAALQATHTIAVVGLSDRVDRPAWEIGQYLQDIGLTIIPVHPTVREVHGERAVRRVTDIPADVEVETVCLFVRPEIGDEVVDDVIERGGVQFIWMQPGATNPAAAERAEKAGIRVVRNACIKVLYSLRMGD
ncbi:MAG: CoA-binding protein [Planctomycetota bacterium]